MKPTYDSTMARIAGNVAGAIIAARPEWDVDSDIRDVQRAVGIARAIVAEVERTEAVAGTPEEPR
jgi:hypothetical protein